MQDYSIFEVRDGASSADVVRKIKDRDVINFRCERSSFLVVSKKERKVWMYNKFTGRRLRNCHKPDISYVYVPQVFKKQLKKSRKNIDEMDLLMKNMQPKRLVGLSFLSSIDNHFAEDFPEIVKAASDEHKKRFNHG